MNSSMDRAISLFLATVALYILYEMIKRNILFPKIEPQSMPIIDYSILAKELNAINGAGFSAAEIVEDIVEITEIK